MIRPQPTAARIAKSRAAREAEGLKRLELWAKPEHHQQIKDYAANLRREKKE